MSKCLSYEFKLGCWTWFFCVVLSGVVFVPSPSQAEFFFKKNSTWYVKIPQNPKIMANSGNYINFIKGVSSNLSASWRDWSVPVWRETAGTPRYDIKILDSSTRVQQGIALNGWALNVPIPLGAKQAGYGATSYRDGHMVVISQDGNYAWDFFRANVDNKSAHRVCWWDLNSDGIRQPYQPEVTGPTCHVAPTPLLHGLITFQEIQNGYIDHALAFATHSAKKDSPGVYPAASENSGTATDPWAPQLGFRYQLDPSLDINSLGLDRTSKIVAKALQEYGMIEVVNAGPGENILYFESLDNKPETWSGILKDLYGIPLGKMKVVEPIMSNQLTTGSLQDFPPDAPLPPQNLQIKVTP